MKSQEPLGHRYPSENKLKQIDESFVMSATAVAIAVAATGLHKYCVYKTNDLPLAVSTRIRELASQYREPWLQDDGSKKPGTEAILAERGMVVGAVIARKMVARSRQEAYQQYLIEHLDDSYVFLGNSAFDLSDLMPRYGRRVNEWLKRSADTSSLFSPAYTKIDPSDNRAGLYYDGIGFIAQSGITFLEEEAIRGSQPNDRAAKREMTETIRFFATSDDQVLDRYLPRS